MNILMYLSDVAFNKEADSTLYLYEGLKDHFDVTLSTEYDASLAKDADVVFSRFELPLNVNFLQALSKYEGKLFVNNPESQIKYHTKHYLSMFPDLTPPTTISKNELEILTFVLDMGKAVLKPVGEFAGRGVKKVDATSSSLEEITLEVKSYMSEYGEAVAQRYIEGVEKYGDKRIHIIGYEPAAPLLRTPKEGSFLCNISAGGSYETTTLTANDQRIINRVKPFLQENGIFWAGLDIIGPYLGEINVSSPGCLSRSDWLNETTKGRDLMIAKMYEYEREL
jgi:glutathione synthase